MSNLFFTILNIILASCLISMVANSEEDGLQNIMYSAIAVFGCFSAAHCLDIYIKDLLRNKK